MGARDPSITPHRNREITHFSQLLSSKPVSHFRVISPRETRSKGDTLRAEMGVSLKFKNIKDFTPEGVVAQVPELKTLLDLRNALNALKGPLGNVPAFRKKIQNLLGDDAAREKLMAELGVGGGEG